MCFVIWAALANRSALADVVWVSNDRISVVKCLPLQQIYALDASSSVCTGCGRTIGEIAEWGSATTSRQHEIVRRSSARMGSSTSHPA
ncbi:DUF1289 domain-containing protein [Sphingopyxis sp. H050]|uniref:DUF1289 domain-containing protein n=1 Tax=Sphingopyxis sp. H050 TaxID=1759072 RepID=UPI003FA767F8